VRQSELSDTFIAVAGLFSADEPKVYAHAALEFAKDVLDEIQGTETELRVLIGITVGGPLLCGLAGTTNNIFTASGSAVEEAVALTELSAPNKVLVSAATKELLLNVDFDPGGDPTRGYFVRFPAAETASKTSDAPAVSMQVSLPDGDGSTTFDLLDDGEAGETE
jgi:class 3 adenylate cyclase